MKKIFVLIGLVFLLSISMISAVECNSNLDNIPCNITSSTTFEQVVVNNTGEQMGYINLDSVDLTIDFNGSELIFTKILFFADGYNDNIANVVLNSYGLTPNATYDDFALIHIVANDEFGVADNFSIANSELNGLVGNGIMIFGDKNLSGFSVLTSEFYNLNFGFDFVPDNNFVSDLYVDGNIFSNMVNGCGEVGDGNNINFLNNICSDSGWGIDVLGDASNVLYQYNNMSNLGSGFYISCNFYGTECVGVIVLDNNLENVGVGIYARNVVDGLINRNNLNTDTRMFFRSFQGEISYNNLTNANTGTSSALMMVLSEVNFSNNLLYNLTNDYGEMSYIYGSTTGVFKDNAFISPDGQADTQKFIVASVNDLLFDGNEFDTQLQIIGGTDVVFKGSEFKEIVNDTNVGTKFCDYDTLTDNTYSENGEYIGVNIGNCPIFSEFNGVDTTDLSSVVWDNFSLVLDNANGKIVFDDNRDFAGSQELNFNSVVEIADKSIGLDSGDAIFNDLNISAELTFENISATDIGDVIIKKDGVVCTTECTNIVLNDGEDTLTFDVTGFSTYTIEEVVSGYVPQFTGNAIADVPIDLLGSTLYGGIAFAGLLGIALVGRFVINRKRRKQ